MSPADNGNPQSAHEKQLTWNTKSRARITRSLELMPAPHRAHRLIENILQKKEEVKGRRKITVIWNVLDLIKKKLGDLKFFFSSLLFSSSPAFCCSRESFYRPTSMCMCFFPQKPNYFCSFHFDRFSLLALFAHNYYSLFFVPHPSNGIHKSTQR